MLAAVLEKIKTINIKEIDNQIWKLRVETLGEEFAKVKSVENAKRSPVEDY